MSPFCSMATISLSASDPKKKDTLKRYACHQQKRVLKGLAAHCGLNRTLKRPLLSIG